jgi:hypothetical protein
VDFPNALLESLVVFIFVTVLLYSSLMTECKSVGTGYHLGAFGVSFLFSIMMFEIMLNARVSLWEAFVFLAAGVVILTLALTRDLDKGQTTPSEAPEATTP